MAKSSPKPVRYDELNTELSELLLRLESSDLSIDDAVKAYERGIEIVTLLEDHLRTAENRVQELKANIASVANPGGE